MAPDVRARAQITWYGVPSQRSASMSDILSGSLTTSLRDRIVAMEVHYSAIGMSSFNNGEDACLYRCSTSRLLVVAALKAINLDTLKLSMTIPTFTDSVIPRDAMGQVSRSFRIRVMVGVAQIRHGMSEFRPPRGLDIQHLALFLAEGMEMPRGKGLATVNLVHSTASFSTWLVNVYIEVFWLLSNNRIPKICLAHVQFLLGAT